MNHFSVTSAAHMLTAQKSTMLPTAKSSFFFTVLESKWGFLWLYLIIINLLAFFLYGLDKLLAKVKVRFSGTRRIPEKTLLLFAALGGGIGAWLGMELFRHKTQHRSFRILVPLCTLVWIVLVGGLYLYFNVIR